MKLYYALGRLISPVVLCLLRWYGRIRHVTRSRVVVRNRQGEVLLIKSWVGTQRWELPGGAPRKNETSVEAARRELKEEVGLDIPVSHLKHHVTLYGGYEADIFIVLVEAEPTPRSWEISAFQWVNPKKLPPGTSALTRLALQKLSKK